VGGLLAQTSVSADAAGYRHLFDFARAQVPGRRCWAVEGAGSYGAGLAAFLEAKSDAWTPSAPPERRWPRPPAGAPSPWGPGGAAGAAGHSACAAKVSTTNQLKALIVGAPEELRAELRGLATKRQIVAP
jgi:transposase